MADAFVVLTAERGGGGGASGFVRSFSLVDSACRRGCTLSGLAGLIGFGGTVGNWLVVLLSSAVVVATVLWTWVEVDTDKGGGGLSCGAGLVGTVDKT